MVIVGRRACMSRHAVPRRSMSHRSVGCARCCAARAHVVERALQEELGRIGVFQRAPADELPVMSQ